MNQYGGVGINDIDTALKEYVFKDTTDRDIYQAMEAYLFNMNTMHSRCGNQIVFSSASFGADTDERARRVCKALLMAYDSGLGKGEQPLFPNLMMKVKSGINLEPGTPNHDILRLSLRVTSKRLNPTYINCDASFNTQYGTNATYMG